MAKRPQKSKTTGGINLIIPDEVLEEHRKEYKRLDSFKEEFDKVFNSDDFGPAQMALLKRMFPK